MNKQEASYLIKEEARRIGFDVCGIAQIAPVDTEVLFLDHWIASGYHGDMKYMENYRNLRLNPAGLVEGARSIICTALNYYPAKKQLFDAPHIAYYAYGRDYHEVVKEKLYLLLSYIQAKLKGLSGNNPVEARVFTDTAPLLERYWAWKAGLGWIGKNTNLIVPGRGSFFFLGEIVINLDLEYDKPVKEKCGKCTRCLSACPTGALESSRCLNATKCLSYLTIEHKGAIPAEEAKKLGNRVYGCDTCQEVCPWNRFAVATTEKDFFPSSGLLELKKETLLTLTREEYNRIFKHSAVKRAKYEGLMRTIKQLK